MAGKQRSIQSNAIRFNTVYYSVQPCEMITTLHTRITQISLTELLEPLSTDHFHEQERISYAMIVSLFAVRRISTPISYYVLTFLQATDSMQRKSKDVGPPSPFRPRSLTVLLQLIQLVMHINNIPSQNLVFPCEHLDIAQVIMVRWGETVPWCWMVWDDRRTVNAEYITTLVSKNR